jgi:hypothetical protein
MDLTHWFSTYGLITAERILGKYQIKLRHDVLLAAIKNPGSFYNRLLQVPLKHVLNGIVITQAHDYLVYVQKLFIDYLLSGAANENSEEEGDSGGGAKDNLEEERTALLEKVEEFEKLKFAQDTLIAKSQAAFIEATQKWLTTRDETIKAIALCVQGIEPQAKGSSIASALDYALAQACSIKNEPAQRMAFVTALNSRLQQNLSQDVQQNIADTLDDLFAVAVDFEPLVIEFYELTKEINYQARSFRTQFYDCILRVNELIKLLPEYRIDPEKDKVNRENLEFDKSLGGD